MTPRVTSIREEAESRLDKLLRREDGTPEKPAADATAGQNLSPGELLKGSQRALEEFQKKVDERVKAVVDNVVGNLPALGRDLGALVQRIEALEKKLDALEEKKR